jgi:hypothetical protein
MPDVVRVFGFIWSGLMFFSAGLNLIVALNFTVVSWASFMSVYGIFSKLVLFLIQYATMRYAAFRRRAQTSPAPSLTKLGDACLWHSLSFVISELTLRFV